MAIKNFKSYIQDKSTITKSVLVATSIAIGLTLTGCTNNLVNTQPTNTPSISNEFSYNKLDRNKLDSNSTEIEEREAYYEKYVEKVIENMSEEEKKSFFVNIDFNYENEEAYSDDNIVFLRNDNHYKGDIIVGTESAYLAPGIYKMLSRDVKENNGNLGEIEILQPGDDVTITIDYATKKATIQTETTKSK